jgi:chromosome segregation ATPase
VEAASIPWRPIGELFVARGLITEEQLEQALAEQAATGQRLGETLVKQNLITSPELTQALMEQLGREVAKEDGFGSGLWAEIQRRNSRGDDSPSHLSVVEADRSPFGSALGEAVANPAEEPSTVNLSQAGLEQDFEDLRTELGVGVLGSPVQEETSAVGMPADLEAIGPELAANEAMVASLTAELRQARESLAAREELVAQEIEARQNARRDAEPLRERLAERQTRLTELEAEVASLVLARAQEAAARPAPDDQAQRELAVWAARLSELEHTLEVREGRIEQLERLAEETRCERDAMSERLTHAESRAAEAERRQHELETASSMELEQQLHAAVGRAAELEQTLRARDERIEALERLRAEEGEGRNGMNERLAQAESRAAEAERQLLELEQQLQVAEGRVSEVGGQITAFRTQLETADASLQEERAAHARTRHASDHAVADAGRAREELREIERGFEALRLERDDARSELDEVQMTIAAHEQRASTYEEELAAAHAELQHACDEHEQARQRVEQLVAETAGTSAALAESERALEKSRGELDRGAGELVDQLAAARAELQGSHAVAVDLEQRLAIAGSRAVELEMQIAALDARLAEETSSHAETRRVLAQALDELAVESVPGMSGEGESALQDYLCFAPSKEGYRLVHGSGRLPSVGDPYDLDGAEHVVTRIGRSPLPFDSRRCVYLQAS